MPTYVVTNLATGESSTIIAPTIKAAHEHACTKWTGVSVEVTSTEEAKLRDIMRPSIKELRSWADAAYCELSEVTNRAALKACLDAIEATVVHLRSKLDEVFATGPQGKAPA